MAKVSLNNLTNLQNETSAVNTINNNNNALEVALENTLSRDGTEPNEMNADLDMNGNRVYNLPEPLTNTEPLRKIDAQEILNLTDEFEEVIEATQGAVDAYESIQALYLGEKTFFPVVDNLGQPLQNGALVFMADQPDPDDDGLYVYHDGNWEVAGTLPTAFERVENILATAGQTVFNISGGYTPGTTKIYRNGVLQRIGTNLGTGVEDDDVTASNGTSITFPGAVIDEDDLITVITSRPYAIVTPPAASDIAYVPTGGVSAVNVQNAITELDTEAAKKTLTITGSGLVTGGGDLSANRVFNVDKASSAEVITGTNDTKATTPLGVAAAIAAAGAAPAMTLITSGTTTSQPSLDLALSGGWRAYMLVFDSMEPVTADQALLVRFSYNNGVSYDAGASNYRYAAQAIDHNNTATNVVSANSNSIVVSRNQAGGGGFGSLMTMRIGVGTASIGARIQWTYDHTFTGGFLTHMHGAGIRQASGIATNVQLIYNSGNIAAGARYQLYGMRH